MKKKDIVLNVIEKVLLFLLASLALYLGVGYYTTFVICIATFIILYLVAAITVLPLCKQLMPKAFGNGTVNIKKVIINDIIYAVLLILPYTIKLIIEGLL